MNRDMCKIPGGLGNEKNLTVKKTNASRGQLFAWFQGVPPENLPCAALLLLNYILQNF